MRERDRRRNPDNLGTVRQLPSGRFQASYRVDGDRFIAPRTFATRAEARAWLVDERADRNRGTWHDPRDSAITLREYATGWLEDRPQLSPRTRDLYERTLDRWILPRIESEKSRPIELGTMELGSIRRQTVRSWHARVLDTANTSATRRRAPAPRTGHPARVWARANGFAVASCGVLSPAVLEAWQAAGAPTPPAPRLPADPDAGRTAAAQAYRLLHAILATAAMDELIPANPCQLEGHPGSVRHRERTIATAAEVDALAGHFPDNLAAAVRLAAWSGLRYGELFALAREHVDLKAGTVRVERALSQVPGKPISFGKPKTARSRRTVTLPAFLVDELRAHMAHHVPLNPDALLFVVASTGNPISSNYLSDLMSTARRRIGRPELTWHDLRHTGATLAYSAGATMREVQNRLGHTTTRAAAIYQHASDDSDRMLAQRLDELHRQKLA